MYVVDTHCHAGTSWFEPVEMLLYGMNQSDVQHAILTQHRGMVDNSYLLEAIERFPGRFSAIVGVDASAPDALTTVEQLAASDGVCGIRLQPGDRSPGSDSLAIWKKACEVGLGISVFLVETVNAADPEFQSVINGLSADCTVVLEHLCGMYAPRGAESAVPPYENYKKGLELAKRPNTYIKFGGLGEFSQRPARLDSQVGFETIPPALEMAYEAFGPKRMMWGSDFPPSAAREGYRNSLQGVLEHPAFKSQEDKDWAFGKTAQKAWKLS